MFIWVLLSAYGAGKLLMKVTSVDVLQDTCPSVPTTAEPGMKHVLLRASDTG